MCYFKENPQGNDLAGEILKKRREELGCDIHEIADLLKIKADYLAAIESDLFPKLPAPVYTMGYIRAYARYLNVDAEPIIKHYTINLTQPGYSTIVPIAFSQKKSPLIFYIIPLLLGAAAFFYFVSPVRYPQFLRYLETEIQGRRATAVTVQPEAERAHVKNIVPAGGQHNLNISANEITWVAVSFGSGKTEEMLLSPGNSRSWSFSEKATLKIGNAGGIRLNLDGRDMGMPGLRGQVVTLSLPNQ